MNESATLMNRDRALKLLGQMILIRRFEEKCVELYGVQKIRGFMHLYVGEEAVATGVLEQLAGGCCGGDLSGTWPSFGPRHPCRRDHGRNVWQATRLRARTRRIDAYF